MFPTPLAILMFLAPESPWWLVRKGRLDQAARSVERLGRKSRLNAGEVVAMMRRVVELEASTSAPSYIELFRKTDLRRTLIVCGIYGAQNLAGNLIANQAVYFFERTLWLYWGMHVLTQSRGRYDDQPRICLRPYHLGLADGLRHGFMVSYNLFWPTHPLSMGHRGQHRPAYCPGGGRLMRNFNCGFVCPGELRPHHLCLVHLRRSARLVGRYWRNVSYPTPTPHYRNRASYILHC